MKNFNILGAHGKIRVLKGGFHEKPIYRGDCLKRGEGLGQFADLRGVMFWERGLIPQCTLWYHSVHFRKLF